jgi:hypothetical protein
MEAYFALTLNDILEFGFDKYYWVKDAYWRILEIKDYKHGQDESTAVVLMKVVNEAVQCNLVPTSSDASGLVSWEDLDGNESDGNAICCNLYGWTWNSEQQKCFANTSTEPTDATAARSVVTGSSINATENSVPSFTLAIGRDIKAENALQNNLLLQGDALSILGEVSYTQVMGKQNEVEVGTFTRGVQLSGVNGKTLLTGRHFAGGVRDNSTPVGAMQTGEILFYNATVFTASGSQQFVYLDNGVPFIFPEDTTWFIQVEALASDSSNFFMFSEFHGVLTNKGGTLSVDYLNPKFFADSVGNQFELEVKITAGGSDFSCALKCNDVGGTPYTFPTPPCTLTCRIKYVQTR